MAPSLPEAKPCFVLGRVLDHGKRPVEGARVTIHLQRRTVLIAPEVITLKDGKFQLGPVPRDEPCSIRVSPFPESRSYSLGDVRTPARGNLEDVEIEVEVGGTLIVHVHCALPMVPRVRIRVHRKDGTTAAEGALYGTLFGGATAKSPDEPSGASTLIRDLAPGDYLVEVVVSGVPTPGPPRHVSVSAREPMVVFLDLGTSG